MSRRWSSLLGFAALIGAALATFALACGDDDRGSAEPPPVTSSTAATVPPLSGKLTVFAAASLSESFRAIGDAFTKANPRVSVDFNFASSSALATQIEQGAPADLFASADQPQMQRIADKRLVEGAAVAFARNLPVIVVPADNRARIASPKDLAGGGVKLVLAAPDVPIGNYSRQIISKLAADPAYGEPFSAAALKNVVSSEPNVRAVLTKVELGEADAGIVYKTDALVAREKVRTVAIPDAANVIAEYPIAVLRDTKNLAVALAFVAFVRGPEGQRLLGEAGFDVAR